MHEFRDLGNSVAFLCRSSPVVSCWMGLLMDIQFQVSLEMPFSGYSTQEHSWVVLAVWLGPLFCEPLATSEVLIHLDHVFHKHILIFCVIVRVDLCKSGSLILIQMRVSTHNLSINSEAHKLKRLLQFFFNIVKGSTCLSQLSQIILVLVKKDWQMWFTMPLKKQIQIVKNNIPKTFGSKPLWELISFFCDLSRMHIPQDSDVLKLC